MLKIIIRKTTLFLFLSIIRGVFGADKDEVKSVSVTEGDSVTLDSKVTEIQSRDQILWVFGPQETRIAEIHTKKIDMFDSNVMFRDRLRMDSQTGSLTIRNITTEHTGLYKLQILKNTGTSYLRFSVTVYGRLTVPVIKHSSCPSSSSLSRCSLLCSVFNVSAVSLSWYKGNSLLSNISVSDLSISLSLPLEVEYQENNTYSCVVNNTISNKTTNLDINKLCRKCAGKNNTIIISTFISVALLAGLLACLMYYLYRKHKRKNGDVSEPSTQILATTPAEEIHYAETEFCKRNKPKHKDNAAEEIIYSSVAS